MSLAELAEITSTKLLPYRKQLLHCPKCDWGPARVPSFLVRWFDIPHAVFKTGYCTGGQDPEKTATMVTPMGEFHQKYTPICTGISEEHLHLTCTHCGYHFLMETCPPRD